MIMQNERGQMLLRQGEMGENITLKKTQIWIPLLPNNVGNRSWVVRQLWWIFVQYFSMFTQILTFLLSHFPLLCTKVTLSPSPMVGFHSLVVFNCTHYNVKAQHLSLSKDSRYGKDTELFIILSCTHLSLLSSIYPLPAMHSLLVTLYVAEYIFM